MSRRKPFEIIQTERQKREKNQMKTDPKIFFKKKMSRRKPFEIIQTAKEK